MFNDVIARLESFGCTAESIDNFTVNFLIQKVENQIKNNCNIDAIPDGLHQVAVDAVCGYYLQSMKTTNPESLSGINLAPVIKEITEGDTSLTYAFGEGSETNEERLNKLIEYLITNGVQGMITYRCMAW